MTRDARDEKSIDGVAAPKKSPRQARRERDAAANREAWAPMQAELAERRARMAAMGGPERV